MALYDDGDGDDNDGYIKMMLVITSLKQYIILFS